MLRTFGVSDPVAVGTTWAIWKRTKEPILNHEPCVRVLTAGPCKVDVFQWAHRQVGPGSTTSLISTLVLSVCWHWGFKCKGKPPTLFLLSIDDPVTFRPIGLKGHHIMFHCIFLLRLVPQDEEMDTELFMLEELFKIIATIVIYYLLKTWLIKSLLKSMSLLRSGPVNGDNALPSLNSELRWRICICHLGVRGNAEGSGWMQCSLLSLGRGGWLCIHLLFILMMYFGKIVYCFKTILLPTAVFDTSCWQSW